jgi:hypothetical protein
MNFAAPARWHDAQGNTMNGTTISTSNSCDDVVIQTLPLFEMMRMRAATTARRHPVLGFAAPEPASTLRWVNQFTHTHRRLGPQDREVVSPNNDTVYSNAWLDLSDGPLVIETPDMGDRYWTLGLLDAWTNPFAYVGRRTTGNRPQRTLVHGPGWRGAVPDGITHTVAAPGDDEDPGAGGSSGCALGGFPGKRGGFGGKAIGFVGVFLGGADIAGSNGQQAA